MNFLQIETIMKSRLGRIPETLNQRHSHCVGIEAEDDNSENSSTQFLEMQKNQLLDLQHFERYCNTLSVFGFSSARYDINLIKSYLMPILVKEPIVIKKTNQFVSFKFDDVQLLDILSFLGGATYLG